ncbi:MAG: glycerophosphodiester phosphodiesterase family protein [Marinifilum sp.]|nr:glycerophosphodiester phosphodiesterase family protein [Marinifilum sp.]
MHFRLSFIYTIGLLLFLITTCTISNRSSNSKKKTNKLSQICQPKDSVIKVCAHRAYHKMAPENSLQSVKEAIVAGIDLVEIDIRTTSDDSLVIMHDETIDRTTNGTGAVKDYTYAELQQFYLRIEDSVTIYKIPTLFEMLSLLKHTKTIANLDQKAVNPDRLHVMLNKLEMQQSVISFTGDWKQTKENLALNDSFLVMPLAKTKDDISLYCDSVFSPLIHLTDETFTSENMNYLHQKGKCVFVNILKDKDKAFIEGVSTVIDSVIALHPCIIQTDHPKLLLEYLRKKGLHD